MVSKIDTIKINEETKKIDKYIKDYNDNSCNIFYEISKLNSYWRGMEIDKLLEKIDDEKKQFFLIVNNLEKINNFYKEFDFYYNKFK